MRTPEIYQDLLLASSRLKDAIVAYTSRESNATLSPNNPTGTSTARDSNTSRDSGETESSWVTANSSLPEHSWATAHSDVIEGSSTANSSNTSYREAREKKILHKQLTRSVLKAIAVYCQAAITVRGLGLGTAFLILDIFYPKVRGLSVYHSFALWMSLVSALEVTVLKTLKYMWRRVQIIYERNVAATSARQRRRRSSDASQSERASGITSDGTV